MSTDQQIPVRFANDDDYRECSRLHRQYGTTYYFSSRKLPTEMRRRVDAIYGFVRLPDEWVDNPGLMTPEEIKQKLVNYRQELTAAAYGVRPNEPVVRAFIDVMNESDIPMEEPLCFLDAMEQDLFKTRYSSYPELVSYMRGSASAVGVMLVYALGAGRDAKTIDAAKALGEAMQLTNFLRDIKEDLDRGRIYLPQDELVSAGITEEDLLNFKMTPEFVNLMKSQIERARQRFIDADWAIKLLPQEVRFGVSLARELYSKILEKIEEADYDVFSQRVRTSPQEKMIAAWRLWSSMD